MAPKVHNKMCIVIIKYGILDNKGMGNMITKPSCYLRGAYNPLSNPSRNKLDKSCQLIDASINPIKFTIRG